MRRLLVSAPAALLLAVASVSAQVAPSTGIAGRVVSADGAPLSFAEVSLGDGRWRATADSLGEFRVLGVEPGTHRLRVRRLGFVALDDEAVVRAGKVKGLSIELERLPMLAPSVRVTAGSTSFGPLIRESTAGDLEDARDFSVRDFIHRTWPAFVSLNSPQRLPTWEPNLFGGEDWPPMYLGGSVDVGIAYWEYFGRPALRWASGRPAVRTRWADRCYTFVDGECVPEWFLDALSPSDLENLRVHKSDGLYVFVMRRRDIAQTY